MLLSATSPPIVHIAVAVVIAVVGTRLAADAARWIREAAERRDGPSVRGRIVGSRVVRRDRRGSDAMFPWTWQLSVVYEYSVGGRVFSGTRITPQPPWFANLAYATWQGERYPPLAEVRVYFDPASPDRAILDPRLTVWSPWIGLAVGLGLAVRGLLALASTVGLLPA